MYFIFVDLSVDEFARNSDSEDNLALKDFTSGKI
jgi:hypothetical protein